MVVPLGLDGNDTPRWAQAEYITVWYQCKPMGYVKTNWLYLGVKKPCTKAGWWAAAG